MFNPLAENNEYVYSIYGVLDASADTQNVRITPARESFRQSNEPFDAVVTLEHLETGMSVVMNDSLLNFGDEGWAWNYYTDMAITPGDTYVLTATRSDGRFSRATVEIPGAISGPELFYDCLYFSSSARLERISVLVSNVDRVTVGDVTYFYRVRDNLIDGPVLSQELYEYTFPQLQNIISPPQSAGSYRLWVTIYDDMGRLQPLTGILPPREVVVTGAEVTLVSAGPDWPETAGLDLGEASLPDVGNSIENGLGALAGIVSMTVPLEHDYICPL